MTDTAYLLWFEKEMPEPFADVEVLIGVYSSDAEARAAIERVKNQPGFAEFPEGFQICPYQLDRDHWTEGFKIAD